MRDLLIILRLVLGLGFFAVSACLGYAYANAVKDHHIAAAGIATVVTFVAGGIFTNAALDGDLWKETPVNRPSKPDDNDEVDYSIKT